MTKNGVGNILGNFCAKPFGHPAANAVAAKRLGSGQNVSV
jgi:hypothetical protein